MSNQAPEDIRLLVVDDECEMTDLIKSFLERSVPHLFVTVANNPDEALTLLSDQQFDIIISDYAMPQKTGLEFLEQVRRQRLEIPFIMFTGKGREEVAVKALKVGANFYLQKGGNINENLEVLSKRVQTEVLSYRSQLTNQFLSSIVEQVREGVVAADTSLNITYVNQAMLDMSGYSYNDVIGQHVSIFRTPEDRDLFGGIHQELMEGNHYSRSGKNRRKDGSEYVVELKVSPIRNEQGVITHFVGINRDITEMWNLQERYRDLFENSPISLWEEDFTEVKLAIDELKREGVVDFETYFKENPAEVNRMVRMVRIVDVNQTSLDLYKATTKEQLYQGLEFIFRPESKEDFRELMPLIANNGTEYQSQKTHQTLEGDLIHIQLYWSVVPGFETTYSRVIVSIVDISSRVRAEEKARFLDTLLRHDLRNHLSVIEGYMHLLNTNHWSSSDQEHLKLIFGRLSVIKNFVEKVSKLQKLEYDEISKTRIISDVLTNVVEDIRPLAQKRGFSFDLVLKNAEVVGGSLLDEVFRNLIENAINHSGGNSIRIQNVVVNQTLVTTVEDNGRGLPPDLVTAFDKRNELTRFGVGLFLICSIVDQYGGKVEIGQSDLGGTCLRVILKRT